MEKTAEIPPGLIASFLTALAAAPDTTAHVVSAAAGSSRAAPSPFDGLVDARIGGEKVRLALEVKRSVFPRDIREAVWRLRQRLAALPAEKSRAASRQTIPMVIAESLTPGARALLREERVGYYDGGGSLYVPARGALLFVDRPPPAPAARSINAPFAGRRGRVLHAVWARKNVWFGVHEIARLAAVSPATTSETLIELESREWVVSRGAGPAKQRRLADWRGLLDDWTAYRIAAQPPAWRYHYVPAAGGAEELGRRMDRAFAEHGGAAYAITGIAAAQAYAPYLTGVSQVHCRFAQSTAALAALRSLDARPVGEGWNLALLDDESSATFVSSQRIGDVRFASPLQTYLDLLQGGGRAREMADHLRREKLGA